MITYLVISLIIYLMLLSIDKISGKEIFNSDNDRMIRVGLSLIWPLTLIILLIIFKRRDD